MRTTYWAPLFGLLLFCIAQFLALYMWLPGSIVQITSIHHCDSSWNKTDMQQVSRDDLQRDFVRLSQRGKRYGLSDKQLMVMLIQGLTSESVTGSKFQNLIKGGISPSIVQGNANKRPMNSGNDSTSKKGDDIQSEGNVLPPLTNISNKEKKNAKLREEEEEESVSAMEAAEGHKENQTVNLKSNITRSQAVGDNQKAKESDQIGLHGDIRESHDESFKWYMSSKDSKPVNPHTYDLVINQPTVCRPDGSELDVFLLVVMISSPGSFTQRDKLRNSSFSVPRISGKVFKHVFLLGASGDTKVTKKVHEEAAKYGDILMEDFQDSYRNLTLKTLMGLKWASFYCPQAKYVLKTDDDVYISFTNLINLLEGAPRERYMTGYVYKGTKPLRNKGIKWYIPKEVYPRDIYPPYCCGIGYVMSGDLPPRIFEVSLSLPYIFLEDVYVGLCIEKLNVVPTRNPGFFTFRQKYDYCMFKTAHIVHLSKPSEVGEYWLQQKTNPNNATC